MMKLLRRLALALVLAWERATWRIAWVWTYRRSPPRHPHPRERLMPDLGTGIDPRAVSLRPSGAVPVRRRWGRRV